jgi:hypothetical protein
MEKAMIEDTLETITGQINAHWNKVDDHRATLGVLMAKAKELVEVGDPFAEGLPWKGYVATHFLKKDGTARTIRDCNRLLLIGNSPDPQAKADEEREKTRTQVAKSRDIRMSQSPIDPTDSTADHEMIAEPTEGLQLPKTKSADMYEELVAAWELADVGERQRFCEYTQLAAIQPAPRDVMRRGQDGRVLDPLPVVLKRVLIRLHKADEIDRSIEKKLGDARATLEHLGIRAGAKEMEVLQRLVSQAHGHRGGVIYDIAEASQQLVDETPLAAAPVAPVMAFPKIEVDIYVK